MHPRSPRLSVICRNSPGSAGEGRATDCAPSQPSTPSRHHLDRRIALPRGLRRCNNYFSPLPRRPCPSSETLSSSKAKRFSSTRSLFSSTTSRSSWTRNRFLRSESAFLRAKTPFPRAETCRFLRKTGLLPRFRPPGLFIAPNPSAGQSGSNWRSGLELPGRFRRGTGACCASATRRPAAGIIRRPRKAKAWRWTSSTAARSRRISSTRWGASCATPGRARAARSRASWRTVGKPARKTGRRRCRSSSTSGVAIPSTRACPRWPGASSAALPRRRRSWPISAARWASSTRRALYRVNKPSRCMDSTQGTKKFVMFRLADSLGVGRGLPSDTSASRRFAMPF